MKIELTVDLNNFQGIRNAENIEERFGINQNELQLKLLTSIQNNENIILNMQEICTIINLWIGYFECKGNSLLSFLGIQEQIQKTTKPMQIGQEQVYDYIDIIKAIIENEYFQSLFQLIMWDVILVPIEINYRVINKIEGPSDIEILIQSYMN